MKLWLGNAFRVLLALCVREPTGHTVSWHLMASCNLWVNTDSTQFRVAGSPVNRVSQQTSCHGGGSGYSPLVSLVNLTTTTYHIGCFVRAIIAFNDAKIFVNTLRPRQNDPHFADDIFKLISLYDFFLASIKISLNYTNPGYGLSLVDTLWNAGSYRQPLEQEGNPMT